VFIRLGKETSGSLKEGISKLDLSHPVSLAALIGPEGVSQMRKPTRHRSRLVAHQPGLPHSAHGNSGLSIATLIMYELGELKHSRRGNRFLTRPASSLPRP